jgi:hypothetical protein
MSGAESRSPGRSGPAPVVEQPATPEHPTPDSISLRRILALLVSVALPLTMLTPWYALRVSARGPAARHGFVQQMTGWQALSGAAIVCLIVALGVCALLIARAVVGVAGLGAAGRRAAQARVDGTVMAAGGLLCVVMLVATAATPPAASPGAIAVSTHTGARWGVLLTLAVALALLALGVQMAAAGGRTLRDRRRTRSPAGGGATRSAGGTPTRSGGGAIHSAAGSTRWRGSARSGTQDEREQRAVDPDDQDAEHDQPAQAREVTGAADHHAGHERGEREVQLGLLGGGDQRHGRGTTLYLSKEP